MNWLTNSMEQRSSWEANRFPPNSPHFYGPRRFVTAFTKALNLSLFWARSIQSMPPSHFWRFSHPSVGLPSGLFASDILSQLAKKIQVVLETDGGNSSSIRINGTHVTCWKYPTGSRKRRKKWDWVIMLNYWCQGTNHMQSFQIIVRVILSLLFSHSPQSFSLLFSCYASDCL